MRYRSRGVFSLGGWWPPASSVKSNTLYSALPRSPGGLRLRGCHPLRPAIPGGSAGPLWTTFEGEPQLHIPVGFLRLVRFELCRFRSPLLPASLFDFFSSPYWDVSLRGVPSPFGVSGLFTQTGGPIRVSPDLRPPAPPRGFSQLAAPFFGSRAEPSATRLVCLVPLFLVCLPLFRFPFFGVDVFG